MAKCKNEVLMNKIGLNKLTDRTEVEFALLNDLPDCNLINTKNHISEVAYPYNPYRIPTNRFDCMKSGCVNTGTLSVEALEGLGQVSFKIPADATEFAAGVITMYIAPETNATYPITLNVTLSSNKTFNDTDTYTVTINESDVRDDGFAAIAVDLSATPSNTGGGGWEPSEAGAFIRVSSTVSFGISSIAIFDDIEDFETSDIVVVGCLSDLSGTFDVPASTSRCWGAKYNTDDLSFDRTITGNKVTPNYWKLNPLHGKKTETTGWISTTVEKTVVALNGFGAVTLADMNQDECGFFGIQIADACNVNDSQLRRLVLPGTGVSFDEKHYVVVANSDGSTTVYFNSSLVGQKVIITYPRIATVERVHGNKENVGDIRVRMSYKISQTDGTEIIYTFNNVLVTSFPGNITTDEPEFSFTISIQPDANGDYYTMDRIIA